MLAWSHLLEGLAQQAPECYTREGRPCRLAIGLAVAASAHFVGNAWLRLTWIHPV